MCAIAWYPARLEDVLHGIPQRLVIQKPRGTCQHKKTPATWLTQPLWFARVRDYVEGSDELTPTDLQNRKTEEANHNNRDLALILRDFRTARECLMGKLQRLDSSVFREAIPHPRLKVPMRLVDYLHFVAEHDDHHLARIWEIIAAKTKIQPSKSLLIGCSVDLRSVH